MSSNIVRDPCTRCAIKHLGQAKILMDESQLGYPHHVWYAMAHMAEAEAEILDIQPEDAALIRESRIKIQDSLDSGDKEKVHVPDFLWLMFSVGVGGLLPEVGSVSNAEEWLASPSAASGKSEALGKFMQATFEKSNAKK